MNTTPASTGERALVLGGAGSAGNAWEIGVIAGLFEAGLDVTEADVTIGTSAGSTAAAQITSGIQPTQLLADILAATPRRRTGPVRSDRGRAPIGPAANHMQITGAIIDAAENAADLRRRMGAAALQTDAASHRSAQTQWRATVAARLPSPDGATQIDELRARGSRVKTIFPDSDCEHMFGANAMDPPLRAPAARAGYNQGKSLAEQLTEFWR